MKNIERLFLFLCIIYLLGLCAAYNISLLIQHQKNTFEPVQYFMTVQLFSTLELVATRLVNIGIAVWVLIDANKRGHKKWVWVFLSLLFSLPALAVYLIYTCLRTEKVDEYQSK